MGVIPCFLRKRYTLGMGRGITTLAEFASKDAGVRIASAHIPYQFTLLRCMRMGVEMRAAGFVSQGISKAVIAAFLRVNVLAIGFVFEGSLGNTKFFSVLNEG